MDCSPPGSSVPGSLQARVLEWVAIAFSTPPGDRKAIQDSAFMLSLGYTLWKQVELILNHLRKDHTRWIPVTPLAVVPKANSHTRQKRQGGQPGRRLFWTLCCRFHAWHRSPAFFLLHHLGGTTWCTVISCPLARGGPFVILAPSFILAWKLSWLCWQKLSLLTPFNASRTGNKALDVMT